MVQQPEATEVEWHRQRLYRKCMANKRNQHTNNNNKNNKKLVFCSLHFVLIIFGIDRVIIADYIVGSQSASRPQIDLQDYEMANGIGNLCISK